MKNHMIHFLKRGILAAAGGPIVLAIVYWILGANGTIESLSPYEVSTGILSVTILSFFATGCSVIYDFERLSLLWATLIHGTVLYLAYILLYLLNGWLEYESSSIFLFTVLYFAGYGLIWLCIYSSIRAKVKKINQNLHT